MTKLHHELGVKTLVRITSEVIIEVPPTRVAVVAVGPGRLQPVQVGDQRLHHLRLYELSPWSLYGGWMPFPHSPGARHTGTEGLHIVLVVVELIVVVIIVVPHHLDLSVQVVAEVSIDTFLLTALAHFSTQEKYRNPLPSVH